MRRARRGLSIVALAGALTLVGPASGTFAAKKTRAKATRSAECALIDITISWTDIGLQPFRICI
jgi:hypothetical protein